MDLDFGFRRRWKISIAKSAHDFATAAPGFRPSAVVGDEKTEACLGAEPHIAVKIECVPAMTDDAGAVRRVFHEVEPESVQCRMQFKLPTLHQADGLRFQNRNTVRGSTLQKSEHESRHVYRRGGERTGRRRLHQLTAARPFLG